MGEGDHLDMLFCTSILWPHDRGEHNRTNTQQHGRERDFGQEAVVLQIGMNAEHIIQEVVEEQPDGTDPDHAPVKSIGKVVQDYFDRHRAV